MFNKKQKKFERELNKILTTTGLLKAAIAGDQDTLKAMATGHGADTEGISFALETLIMVAHRNPAVISNFREMRQDMPPKALTAFITGISAAEIGNVRDFQGDNVVGQAIFIIALATLIADDHDALADAMATVMEYSQEN